MTPEQKINSLTDMLMAVAEGGKQSITWHSETGHVSVEAGGETWTLEGQLGRKLALALQEEPAWEDSEFIKIMLMVTA